MDKAPYRALFLDFDGTLVPLQQRPEDVKLSAQAKRILARLTHRDNVFVAVVSGRKRSDLIQLVGVKGVHLFGLQGAERAGKKPAMTAKIRRALVRAKRRARSLLASIPGIWIEDKGVIFTVHYRAAKRAGVERARKLLRKVLAPSIRSLHILHGAKTWEILPIQLRGKGAAVEAHLREMPAGTIAVYIGDDGTDETALAVLREHISVRVGEKKDTKANFYLRDSSEVLRFLSRLEREIL